MSEGNHTTRILLQWAKKLGKQEAESGLTERDRVHPRDCINNAYKKSFKEHSMTAIDVMSVDKTFNEMFGA